ncbi:MAG: flagellar hook-basal body complex protein FliE [Treponema sp.]|nr:flagellar hook-basal body complex protein FliE [Treponema sp.]
MTATKVEHIGGINRVAGQNKVAEAGEVSGRKGAFETYLLDAVSKMNEQQVQVSSLQKQIVTDPDSVDIHDVTIAMAKAQSSMSLAKTVIDRIVSGWTELSQNR